MKKSPKKRNLFWDQIAAGLLCREFEGKASKAEKVNRLMAEFKLFTK
jgi:hypothetical protein